MASCERCWRESGGDPERYRELIQRRTCTPEEQAGDAAKRCPACERMTLHQYTGDCMNALCPSRSNSPRQVSTRSGDNLHAEVRR
jgi:hypothetical protein